MLGLLKMGPLRDPKALEAFSILVVTSDMTSPSLHKLDPKYMNQSTISISPPSTCTEPISLTQTSFPITIPLVFWVLTVNRHFFATSTNFLAAILKLLWELEYRATSSANCVSVAFTSFDFAVLSPTNFLPCLNNTSIPAPHTHFANMQPLHQSGC